MTWSPFFTEVTPGPVSTTTPAPSWPRIAGNSPSGSLPDSVNSSVWQMPVALISTSTSPALGPSSCTCVTASGLPAANATAARTSMLLLLDWLAHHQLRLRHDGRELAVAAGDAGLPDRGGAAAVQRRTFGAGHVARGDAGEEIGLALDRGCRAAALRQIGGGGGAAEVVGERHQCAAVQHAVPVGKLLGD